MNRNVIVVRNRQQAQRLNTRLLREIVHALIVSELFRQQFEIGITIVGELAMTRINETYLRHKGSTDVITFDYSDANCPECLAGELFVCLDEALVQAPRFRGSWQNELVRYIVHGILHLAGYDDKVTLARRKMKRKEDHVMRHLAIRFKLARIGRPVGRRRTAAR